MSRQELHPRTEALNKIQKNKSKKARKDALTWLVTKFPNVFDNSLRIRPLKKGIMQDIIAYADEAKKAGISKSKLREAVVLFTRRIDYLTCLKAREMRIDLEGHSSSDVTEEEAEKAASKIKKRVEKSARNARKNIASKIPNHYQAKVSKPIVHNHHASMDQGPRYPERPPAFSQSAMYVTQKPSSASVVVKHKTARHYDPEAVARLKAKLGLSHKKADNEKEIAD